MKLAVVIIHYNTSSDLELCLESLAAHRPACRHEVVVVDNASVDPQLAAVRERFGEVRWLMNTENVGYARGCNLGMQAVPAEFYLILNPDIVVQPGSIDRLLEFAADHPRAGIIGPQLLNENGSIQESCRRFYTLKTLLLRRTVLGRIFPRHQSLRLHLMKDFDHRSSRPVDWVLGGAMLVRRSAIDRTGPMDERFFLYFEDVDLCYRMWQAGCEVQYTPEARFQHRHRRASAAGTFNRTFWMHLGSLISFYEKWGILVWLVKKWREPLLVFLSWMLDMAGVGAAFTLAYGVRGLAGSFFPETLYPFREYVPLLAFAWLLVTVVFLTTGRYAPGKLRHPAGRGEDLQRVGVVFLLLLASTYLGHLELISRAVLLIFLPLLAGAAAVSRWLLMAVIRRLERGRLSLERTLLVGPPARIQAWLAGAGDLAASGVDLVGFSAAAPGGQALPPLSGGAIPWLGPPDAIAEIVRRYRILQVVFWEGPSLAAQDLARWAALRRLRVKLRWHLPDNWLVAAGARAELFGCELSAVQGSGGGSALRALGQRALSGAAGLLLAIPTGGSWLWLRLWGGRRGDIRPVSVRDLWGYHPELSVAVSPVGRLLPLIRQWGLAAALIRGTVALFGPSPLAPKRGPDRTGAAEILEFWRREPAPPALTGPWADGRTHGPAGLPAVLAQLWCRPGGLDTIVGPSSAAPDPQPNTSPGEEVTRS